MFADGTAGRLNPSGAILCNVSIILTAIAMFVFVGGFYQWNNNRALKCFVK